MSGYVDWNTEDIKGMPSRYEDFFVLLRSHETLDNEPVMVIGHVDDLMEEFDIERREHLQGYLATSLEDAERIARGVRKTEIYKCVNGEVIRIRDRFENDV